MTYNHNVSVYEYIMEWTIEQYSYCWHKKGEELASPVFTATLMGNTKWKLILYPFGKENGNYVSYFLHREEDEGPDSIVINYNLEILRMDRSVLKEYYAAKKVFEQNDNWGIDEFEERIKILKLESDRFLPQNTLTVRCRMGRCGNRNTELVHICAKTVINFEKRTFKWIVQNFISLQPHHRIPFSMESTSKEIQMGFSLFLNEEQHSDEIIFLDITCFIKHFKFFLFKMFVIDSRGNKVECGQLEFWQETYEIITMLPAHLNKKKLLEQKDLYLKEDALTLNFECFFPIGISYEGIVSTNFKLIVPQTKNALIRSFRKISSVETQSDIAIGFKEDFKTLYRNGFLSDIKLCTETESFLAHAAILSARSPVFKVMFSDERVEKIKEIVEIFDLDGDTMRRMLLYMYTDVLEDLQWESALGLYQAAAKYQILSLKRKCLAFLEKHLSPITACEALVLADRHQDRDFKKIVQKYIINRDKYIFNLEEWKSLMMTNPELAVETMHLFWEREQR
ncbi:TD and POZ domain-containing protein 5 [Nephila pilipes]|uniref:TD and POZ domain-containing protein 5 n=1 Tax=Nephila pilipes TaxID=299642 RepID=A0A8X6QV44_NEPPI|nr:TD and POZ domain-containing protein 5 [Nephila pilipes]